MRTIGIILVALLLCCAGSVSAQQTGMFREQLARPDSLHGSRVIVTEVGDAAAIVKMLQSSRHDNKVNGYRVRIFFDNSQNARSNAQATQERFRELFPEVPVYMNYENPYFKVTVGNCLTIEEAIILWGRVKGDFDRAFVIREEIPVSVLAE